MERELIGLGLRLRMLGDGTGRLEWRDLYVIITQADEGSPIRRAVDPEGSVWGLSEHLLAVIADALHAANWQRAGAEDDPPRPIPRPGVEDVGAADEERFVGEAMTADELHAFLGWDVYLDEDSESESEE